MLEEIISIVRKSGDIILFADDVERSTVSKEGRANFVTKYDVAVQTALQKELLRAVPDAAFIGEEGDHAQTLGQGLAFIVDPIDGTTNFIKDYHKSCVSVALADHGEIVLAVVYNPYTKEVFSARKGRGAFLNGQPIHVTDHPLSESLVCVGTSPYYPEWIDRTFDLAKVLYKASLDIRRSGSAALDLCDIACGRCGLYFEACLSPWDYAAGSLIVQEAGGRVSRMNGKAHTFLQKESVLAGSRETWETYFKLPGHVETD